jgi:hypothetical protein
MQLATWTRPDMFSHSFQIRLEDTGHWLEARFRSEQGGPVTNSPMLKAAGNSELLTFTDSDFASCEETRKAYLESSFSFVLC